MAEEHPRTSPPWSPTTKLVVSLTVVAILAGLFIQFHGIIGPLLLAFLLAYLLNPLAETLQTRLHFSWGLAVSVIYLLLLLLMLSLLTLGGVGIVQQVSSLVTVVQQNVSTLPQIISDLSGRVYQFGPFQYDFRHMDLNSVSSQVLGTVQSLLGRTGTLLSTVAGGAASFMAWGMFVMI